MKVEKCLSKIHLDRTALAMFPMCDTFNENYEKEICMLKAFVEIHDCLDTECPLENGQCEKGYYRRITLCGQ